MLKQILQILKYGALIVGVLITIGGAGDIFAAFISQIATGAEFAGVIIASLVLITLRDVPDARDDTLAKQRKMQGFRVPRKPSENATFLLFLFLSKTDRQVIPGDLDEEYYTTILPKFGALRAWWWYWTHALAAIIHRNPLFRWMLIGGGLARFGEWVFGKIGT